MFLQQPNGRHGVINQTDGFELPRKHRSQVGHLSWREMYSKCLSGLSNPTIESHDNAQVIRGCRPALLCSNTKQLPVGVLPVPDVKERTEEIKNHCCYHVVPVTDTEISTHARRSPGYSYCTTTP